MTKILRMSTVIQINIVKMPIGTLKSNFGKQIIWGHERTKKKQNENVKK